MSITAPQTPATAPKWYWYSFDSGCTGKGIDPIGAVFLGKHASGSYVDIDVEDRLEATYPGSDWGHNADGQNFYTKYPTPTCVPGNRSVADHGTSPISGAQERYHMRFAEIYRTNLDPPPPTASPQFPPQPGKYMYWTLGTPHYEWPTGNINPTGPAFFTNHCIPGNHTKGGGGFNRGRRRIKRAYQNVSTATGFYEVRVTAFGETAQRGGCNGSTVSSSGHVVWFRLGAIPNGVHSMGSPYGK